MIGARFVSPIRSEDLIYCRGCSHLVGGIYNFVICARARARTTRRVTCWKARCLYAREYRAIKCGSAIGGVALRERACTEAVLKIVSAKLRANLFPEPSGLPRVP